MPYMDFIDGMRATAVIAVIVYHFGFQFLPGGYTGVDVFFVISGFLITGIIQKNILDNTFSLRKFYERRFRRLLPVLALVVLTTLAVAPFFLGDNSLIDLSHSAMSVALFLSNMFFWQTESYFSEAASLRPLLHTWSLGVEEQFYAVFPLIMLLFLRLRRRGVVLGMTALLLISYGVNIYLSQHYPNAAFYFLPARIWEFLLGSLIAMNTARARLLSGASRNCLMILGALLLGYGFFTISSHDVFPGHAALIPVLGSCFLIIGSLGGRTLVGDVLGARPIRYIGLISYSLYLWLWVIAAFARSIINGEFSFLQQIILIAMTFFLSVLTFHFVEKPFRFSPRFSNLLKLRGSLVLLLVMLLVAAGYGMFFKQRVAAVIAAMPDSGMLFHFMKPCEFSKEFSPSDNDCSFGDAASEKIFLVWGDSHGVALLAGFDKAARDAGWRGLTASRRGCPPLMDVYTADDRVRCNAEFADDVIGFVRGVGVDHIFLVARWPMYQTGKIINGRLAADTHFISDGHGVSQSPEASARVLERSLLKTVELLTSFEIPITIVLPTPVWPHMREQFTPQDQALSRDEYRAQRDSVDKMLVALTRNPLVNVLDPADVICPLAECQLFQDEEPLYLDNNHLTPKGARMLSGLIEDALATE